MLNCSLPLRIKAAMLIWPAKELSFAETIIKVQYPTEFMHPLLFDLTGDVGS